MIRNCLLATSLLAVIGGCAPGINVTTDYDPQQAPKFTAWKTYSWLPAPQGGQTRNQALELVGGRVQRSVDAQLAAKGYQLVAANPDFQVGWHASVEGKMDVTSMNSYYGYGWGYGYNSTSVREYDEGTLILDVVDPAAKQLSWRGVATGELSNTQDQAERERRVNEAVAKILEKFPPKG